MSVMLNAFEALEMVPGWNADLADVEELKGGLTNRTYHVRIADIECVLRLDSEQSRLFQFDRACEVTILKTAADAGLAPGVIYSNPEAGVLVTEYLPGRVWEESDLGTRDSLEALSTLLRTVHSLPACGVRVDTLEVARTYERFLEKRQGLHSFATRCVEIIDSVPSRSDVVCCHNDVVAANVVQDESLKLIDWEYACDNDPLFDLASAIGYHNLDLDCASTLLDAYTGGADGEAKERLEEQLRVYDAIQWLWLATRHLVYPSRAQARRLEELQQRVR